MRRKIIPYKAELKELARHFRNNPTFSEKLLWQRLKGKQVLGFDFHRQKPIDRYIVDFYCPDLQLAIEIDGETHFGRENEIRDEKRQKRLESLGVIFLRFNNEEVKRNIDGVVRVIEEWIIRHRPNVV